MTRRQRYVSWLKNTPYRSLYKKVPEKYLRELQAAIEVRGTHVTLWPNPQTIEQTYRLGLSPQVALVYTPQESADFLAAGHPESLLLQYADSLSPMEALEAAEKGVHPRMVDAAFDFGVNTVAQMKELQDDGAQPFVLKRLAANGVSYRHVLRYKQADVPMPTLFEYAVVVPLAAAVPAYQTGKTPDELAAWVRETHSVAARDLSQWLRDVNNVVDARGHAYVKQFIQEMYEWANPGLPDEYLQALIQYPNGYYGESDGTL